MFWASFWPGRSENSEKFLDQVGVDLRYLIRLTQKLHRQKWSELGFLRLGVLWWFCRLAFISSKPSVFGPFVSGPVKWSGTRSFSVWSINMISINHDVLNLVGHSTKTFCVNTVEFLATTLRNISEIPFLKPSSYLKTRFEIWTIVNIFGQFWTYLT